MPGIQVLFAFLLILPFQNRFRDLTLNQEYVYFAALVCAAFAIVLLYRRRRPIESGGGRPTRRHS